MLTTKQLKEERRHFHKQVVETFKAQLGLEMGPVKTDWEIYQFPAEKKDKLVIKLALELAFVIMQKVTPESEHIVNQLEEQLQKILISWK